MQIIPHVNPLSDLINQIFQMMSSTNTTIPSTLKEQVKVLRQSLENDITGLANTILDFTVNCACVDFSIETENKSLTKILNNWLENINSNLRGKIPCGIKPLEKQYYLERWKASSLIVLRVIWEDIDGWIQPSLCWFVDGEDIEIDTNDESALIGSDKYYLNISKNNKILLPKNLNESIYIQKPFEKWSETYPVPFVIKRGIYKNIEIYRAFSEKGESLIRKAIEYLLLMRKGTEGLAKTGNANFSYTNDDLKSISTDFKKIIKESRETGSTPSYFTNFDTQIDHLIPDYTRILSASLYSQMERRLLAGLGIIDILESTGSTRKEGLMSPKPLISEINSGINDFSSILDDLVTDMIIRNKVKHRKLTGNMVKINHSPVKEFIDTDLKQILRSVYDRGGLSLRTLVEVVGESNFDVEIERRKGEESIKDIMFPPVIQNTFTDNSPVSKKTNPKEEDPSEIKDRIDLQ